jgi:hypothetical protein
MARRWVDTAARRIRRRLNGVRQPGVVGHLDWYSESLHWEGHTLRVVHDWDSLAVHPEAAIAGVAAAIFPTSAGGRLGATLDESVSFLEQYAETRGRREREPDWAHGSAGTVLTPSRSGPVCATIRSHACGGGRHDRLRASATEARYSRWPST